MHPCLRTGQVRLVSVCLPRLSVRGLVSPAFQCQDVWEKRMENQIISKVRSRLGEFFVELDRKFTTELRGSAVDVDIFANAAQTESELEQLEELLFKLRRTPHSVHSPESTNHAAVRAMIGPGAGEEHLQHLVRMLEDRTNYGVFLDRYTSVLILDKLLEEGRLSQGARVASHLMLQEETDVTANTLGNLASWRYFVAREDVSWLCEEEQIAPPEEEDPDDVIRVRVREGPPDFGMVPNNYQDDHFDLREPEKILGKTLWYLNKSSDDCLSQSLTFLGLIMWGRIDLALKMNISDMVEEICTEIIKITDNANVLQTIKSATKINKDIDQELLNKCKGVLVSNETSLIEEQKKLYARWNKDRDDLLSKEFEKIERRKNREFITQIKEELTRDEERLFFFDNKEMLDQEKEEKITAWKRTFPRRSWPSTKGYFHHPKWIKTPGKEMKVPRWEKRELKKGPPK